MMAVVPTAQQDLLDQIAFIESLITAIRAAILAFYTNGAQKIYRFDTGQQIINVERESPKVMNDQIQSLMNQKQILCQRAGLASGTLYSRGAW